MLALIAGHPAWHFVLAALTIGSLFVVLRGAGGWRPAPGGWPKARVVVAGWVGGSIVYAMAILAASQRSSVISWRQGDDWIRWVAMAAITLAAGVLVVFPRQAAARPILPLVLVGFGAAWTGWGVVDQHLLHTFALMPQSAWAAQADGLFHGVGIAAAGAGTWLFVRDGSRSTLAALPHGRTAP
jgi:hypothetical protein